MEIIIQIIIIIFPVKEDRKERVVESGPSWGGPAPLGQWGAPWGPPPPLPILPPAKVAHQQLLLGSGQKLLLESCPVRGQEQPAHLTLNKTN